MPKILVGPMLRDVCTEHVVLWFVSSVEAAYEVTIWADGTCIAKQNFTSRGGHVVRVGNHAWVYCLAIEAQPAFPSDTWLEYDLQCCGSAEPLIDGLSYLGAERPRFVVQKQLHEVLHGSCRKPHHVGEDGLRTLDDLLARLRESADRPPSDQPAMLIMSGDQVYVDDVAGPMLRAIRQVIDGLGLYEEALPGATIDHSNLLDSHSDGYYRRANLLPDVKSNRTLRELFFGGVQKPIFTTQNADNHLISLSEMMAQYFLVWSPVLWEYVSLDPPNIRRDYVELYANERKCIESFRSGLSQVRRALANIPVYMIFDDHDITDDWNLSRAWEESAYQNSFSRRVIGNALFAYMLCQAWGNKREAIPQSFVESACEVVPQIGEKTDLYDAFIDDLLDFEGWSFTLDTKPAVVVLDTRTRRWRAETHASSPSGLMDWEALSDMQQTVIDRPAVILVSPAPIFGVKLIEVIQRIFTWFGQALMVDAENWMAHPGSAHVMLNIFHHKRTPHYFTILSGDVHYSFVYDVRLRRNESSPHIWQITSSGILNQFPHRLLVTFDKLNRWLFASRSPLNWFTRRRHMRVRPRRPSSHPGRYQNQRLFNGCGIGRVVFDERGAPCEVEQVLSQDVSVSFTPGYESDWVD